MNCPNCGKPLVFSPDKNQLHCEQCDNTQRVDAEVASDKKPLDFPNTSNAIKSKVVHCTACGADSAFTGNISKNCSYCASPIVDTKTIGVLRPDSIIPFSLNKEFAQQNIKKWLSRLWFAPNSLKHFANSTGMNDIKGCYIPFWRFDTQTKTYYEGERGEYYYEQVTQVVNGKTINSRQRQTKWTRVSGNLNNSFKNVLELAQESIPEHLVDDLEPWYYQKNKKFEEKYLLGFETLLVNKDVKTSWQSAKSRVEEEVADLAKKDIGGDEQRLHYVEVKHSNEKYDQISLPLWIAAYKFNNRSFRVCVNGQTGKIDGERPYSVIKIILFILAIIVVGLTVNELSYHPVITNTPIIDTP